MAKFKDVAEGQLARRAVEFPLPSGRLVTVAVVPLFGESEAEILAAARAYAQAHGVPDPKKGDELYEFGIWVHTVVRGVVDPDSPADAPQPFFDGGVAQILDPRSGLGREWIALLFEAQQAWQDAFFDGGVAQILDPRSGLGREWIALLFEAQQAWQDELAPRPKEMGAVEFLQHIMTIVEAPPRAELPFFRWRRVLQDSFLRTLCKTLFAPHPDKSPLGATSPDTLASLTTSASQPTSNTPKPSESAPSQPAVAPDPEVTVERKA